MRGAPIPPAEYGGEHLDTDEKLRAEGWAAGLDVWEQVGKAYEWYLKEDTLGNAQLWSLREAIRGLNSGGLHSMTRPYVLLSVATSIDSHIDDESSSRLLLSNAEDFDRVDQVRAECDAILIGAGTMRADNPRLLVNSEQRRAARIAAGKPEHPLKVTVTASGDLDSSLKFWHYGDQKVAYTTDAGAEKLRDELARLADVVSLGETLDFGKMLDDLGSRGVNRLMVEGGSSVHTAFLSQGLADELHLAIAPLIVGEASAPSFLNPARYPGGSTRPMKLADVIKVGDVVVLRYLPKQDSVPEAASRAA